MVLHVIILVNSMNINEVLELEIIAYDHEGIGIGKKDNFPVFVKGALVGEYVKCRVTYKNKNLAEAKLIKVIKQSQNRNLNPCKYSGICGGCNIMHMSYPEQLAFKKQMVTDTLRKIGRIETKVNDVVPNPNQQHYRNKIIVPVGVKNGEIVTGFYESKSHNLVVQDECLIEPVLSRKIIDFVKKELAKLNVEIYNEESHSGLVRNIMLRKNYKDEYMLVLIATKNAKVLKDIIINTTKEFSEIKSAYLNINPNKTNVILNPTGYIHICNDETIIEDICGLKFSVHPNSFLQVNHDQTEALYNKVLELIKDDENQTIIDAYCGIGSITLNLAKKAKMVYGIEIVPQAIDNANMNKKLNHINNVEFICGKCEDEIIKLTKLTNVDTIVFDPPRKGCDKKFLDTVITMNIKNIVYVSCNPATLARDLRYLLDSGYELKEVHPFDLFSHTSHVETVCLLSKVEK